MPCHAHEVTQHTVTIQIDVPEGTGKVFLAGNTDELGNWDAAGKLMDGDGVRRTATISAAEGTRLEFKCTLGNWNREALADDGSIPENRVVAVDGDKTVRFKVTRFRGDVRPAAEAPATAKASLPTPVGAGVLGTLRYWHNVESEYLTHPRHVVIWLPPGISDSSKTRFPVLYMHDGQNLFDPRLAFTGIDWGVDEVVVRLLGEGKIPPIVVVGVFNSSQRSSEYNPLSGGEDYARFLIGELKPKIDAEFPTLADARHTGTMGSSAGGLISVGLGWRHPDVFTRIGAMSAHLSPAGKTDETDDKAPLGILDAIETLGPIDRSLKIYVDRGDDQIDETYAPHHQRFRELLLRWGRIEGRDFLVRHFEKARHTEADWRTRLDEPIEFLFGDLVE